MSTEVQMLSMDEANELARLEKTVLDNEDAALAYVTALRDIRDNRLYRATHASFVEYCKERFGKTARAINTSIQALTIREGLWEEAQTLPDDQRVAVEQFAEKSAVKTLMETAWVKQNRRVDAILEARDIAKAKPITALVVRKAIARINHRPNPTAEREIFGALADQKARLRGEPDLDINGPWSHSGGHLICGHVAIAKILVSRRSGSTTLLDTLCERLNHPPLKPNHENTCHLPQS